MTPWTPWKPQEKKTPICKRCALSSLHGWKLPASTILWSAGSLKAFAEAAEVTTDGEYHSRHEKKLIRPDFHQTFLDVSSRSGEIDAKRLGQYLGRYLHRVIDGVKIMADEDGHQKAEDLVAQEHHRLTPSSSALRSCAMMEKMKMYDDEMTKVVVNLIQPGIIDLIERCVAELAPTPEDRMMRREQVRYAVAKQALIWLSEAEMVRAHFEAKDYCRDVQGQTHWEEEIPGIHW